MPTTNAALSPVPKTAMAQSFTPGGTLSTTTSATDSTRDGTGPSRPAVSSEAPRAASTASSPAPAARVRMDGT